ncbi:MAG: outer membrane beta-barrel protein, partial [Bacteroidales bacterium]|nr:outer membrane beta-barrel protein [Bacteroidales bacterium]
MKRIMIALAAVTLAFSANAQQDGFDNYAGLNLGGGLNTMTFNPTRGDHSLGLGFDAGLHYAHFFNEHVGLGLGVHYTYANAYAKYNFIETTAGLTHPGNPNVNYTLNTTFNNWKERENVGVLGIPVEIFYRSILNETWTFIGGVGVQFDIPVHGRYYGSDGDFSTTGTFPALGNYTVRDVPEHGFSTYDNTFDSKMDNLGFNVSAILDLGMRLALNNHWGLYFGIYGGYGLNNMISEVKSDPLLVVNTDDPSQIQYNGTFASNEIDALHMVRAGVKIGIDLGWESPSKVAAREAAERAAAEAAAAQAAAERAAAEKAAREKAAAEKAAAEKAA